MAQLLRSLDDEVYVRYNTFGLDGTALPEWSSPTDEIYHFVAAVRLESWDAEPGPADASWTPVSSTTFVAENGVVAIAAMMDGRGHDFLIGPPRFEYGVHMYLDRPRARAARATTGAARGAGAGLGDGGLGVAARGPGPGHLRRPAA
jgi:hypothetical protein